MTGWDDFDEGVDVAAPRGVRVNRRRGQLAERRLAAIFRRRGHATLSQMPVVVLNRAGVPEAGLIDLVPLPRRDGRPAPAAFESKYVDLSRYREPGGGLAAARLQALVRRHADEARWYEQGLRGVDRMRRQQGLPARLPQQVRLIYQVPRATSPDEAARFQRLAAQAAAAQGIRVTVFMPNSPAARVPPQRRAR